MAPARRRRALQPIDHRRVVAERVSADELAANHPEVSAMIDHGFAVQMADLPQ